MCYCLLHEFKLKIHNLSVCSLTNQIVALKEIRLQEEEGAPFTAIREGQNVVLSSGNFTEKLFS